MADEEEEVYRLKASKFGMRNVSIIMQGANGPCPLIALANVLLLRGKIVLNADYGRVAFADLLALVADHLCASNPPVKDDKEREANRQQQISDVIAILPKLKVGLDVNVRFTDVSDFEYTAELAVFDMLNVNLFHGWVAEPDEDAATLAAIGQRSYNQLVEAIINGDGNEEALRLQEWLDRTASQMTFHGLVRLAEVMAEGELAVVFRNNHFSTLLKRQGQLYMLVTDQGYLREEDIVWEVLQSLDGDNDFVNYAFGQGKAVAPLFDASHLQDPDYLLAKQLQEEEERQAGGAQTAAPPARPAAGGPAYSEARAVPAPTRAPASAEAQAADYRAMQEQRYRELQAQAQQRKAEEDRRALEETERRRSRAPRGGAHAPARPPPREEKKKDGKCAMM